MCLSRTQCKQINNFLQGRHSDCKKKKINGAADLNVAKNGIPEVSSRAGQGTLVAGVSMVIISQPPS